jgi:hypothetical protein
MEASRKGRPMDYDFHMEIGGSPGIEKTVFGAYLLGQLVWRFHEVEPLCLLYCGKRIASLTKRAKRGEEEWSCRVVEKDRLEAYKTDFVRTIAAFDRISEKQFMRESPDFPRHLFVASIAIGSPGVTGWWSKKQRGVQDSWYMPLWQRDDFYSWLLASGISIRGLQYSGLVVEGQDIELVRGATLLDIFGFNPRSILGGRRALQGLGRALTEKVTLDSCFNRRFWDPAAIRLGCHRLMVLRTQGDNWSTVKRDPISQVVARVMFKAVRRKHTKIKIHRMLIGVKEYGALFYGTAFEEFCHCRLIKGGEFMQGACFIKGTRKVDDLIVLPRMQEERFSAVDWDDGNFSFLPLHYHMPWPSRWPVWDSCAAVIEGSRDRNRWRGSWCSGLRLTAGISSIKTRQMSEQSTLV